MQYNEVLNRLQNLINKTPTQSELVEILGIKQSTMSERAKRNSKFSPKEISQLNEHYGINLYIDITETSQNDFVPITVRGEVTASMGFGIVVNNESRTGTYSISRQLANDLGITQNNCEMIFASGDSMLPTIEGGDSLLVDCSRKEVYDGRIYCVRIEGQLYAKRLQKIPPSKIIVISDNSKYQSFEIDFSKKVDFDFEVIGEIRWWGRVAR